MSDTRSSAPLLDITDLHTYFNTDTGTVKAVDGISLAAETGETVAIVGESGSGKTVASESITRLFKSPPGYIPEGSIKLNGREVTEMSDDELRTLRGEEVSHIFQNPQGALNPVYSVGWQIREAITLHQDVSEEAARERAVELLTQVGVPEASSRLDDYPHEFSGGQKQRVIIAIALACEPDLLIADEPTTALDVTIQAQILKLLNKIQEQRNMGMLFITHDLGVVAEVADRVVVMYAGKVMERGTVYEVFEDPSHPYTRAMLSCLPGSGELGGIPGDLPDPKNPPDGCRFADRCDHAVEACHTGGQPQEYPVRDSPDHEVSCVHFGPSMDSSVVLDEDATTEAATDAELEADRQ
jgi:peptide/nickel transport system ATP-binding protein